MLTKMKMATALATLLLVCCFGAMASFLDDNLLDGSPGKFNAQALVDDHGSKSSRGQIGTSEDSVLLAMERETSGGDIDLRHSGPLKPQEDPEPSPSKQEFLKFSRELANMTRETGDAVKLKCEVYGIPAPRKIRWYKNEVPVVEERGRVVIRNYNSPPPSLNSGDEEADDYYDDDVGASRRSTGGAKQEPMPNFRGSRLRIVDLEVLDSGFYKCEVTNGAQRVSSTGIVVVKPGQSFGRERQTATVPQYSPLFPPNFEGSYIDMDTDFNPAHGFGHNLAPPPVPELTFGGGMGGSGPVGGLNPGGGLMHQPASGGGKCQVYEGATCALYVGNSSVYIAVGQNQAYIEQRMTEAITVIAHSADLSKQCEKYAIPALCYTTFPPCKRKSRLRSGPVYICRDECEVLEHDICKLEYAIAKRHPLIGMQIKLPDCAELPPIASPASEDCIRIGMPRVAEIKDSDTCYDGKGENYRGTMSRTISGHECVPWADKVRLNPIDHPELIGGHNYCRNPGGKMEGPWCFSSSYGQVQELCDVPRCDDNLLLYIAIPCVAALMLLILLVSVWCFKRRIRGGAKTAQSGLTSPAKSFMSGKQVAASPLEMNALLTNGNHGTILSTAGSSSSDEKRQRAPEIPLANIRFLQELGEGAFGKVFKGEILNHDGKPVSSVAVKTLKNDATPKVSADFRREADLMVALRHPNIVCLVAVAPKTPGSAQLAAMLFEHMTQGDLHEFLATHSPRGGGALEPADLIHFATQIAAGMEYLASCHYVHRDLASRNCLVGENLTVKIGDFGLSRDVYSSDYYRVETESLLPVRWMPPEAIMYGKFTTESDIWSYGVVCWEIWSYGLQPYYGYSNQEVIELVRNRQLLPCPEDCPPRIYGMMVECWHEMPSRRPTFTELHNRLRSWHHNPGLQLPANAQQIMRSHTPSQHSGGGSTGSTSLTHHYQLQQQYQMPIQQQQQQQQPAAPSAYASAPVTSASPAFYAQMQTQTSPCSSLASYASSAAYSQPFGNPSSLFGAKPPGGALYSPQLSTFRHGSPAVQCVVNSAYNHRPGTPPTHHHVVLRQNGLDGRINL